MNAQEWRAEVARAGLTNRSVAKEIGMSEQALYSKLSGRREFKNSEIKAIARMLGLDLVGVNTIFFDGEVN